jgi:hypothetical protein
VSIRLQGIDLYQKLTKDPIGARAAGASDSAARNGASGVPASRSARASSPHARTGWPRVDRRHHRFVMRRFPYSVFYRFNDTELTVVAIAHHKRPPGYWARRR